jgi:hypothetical protein
MLLRLTVTDILTIRARFIQTVHATLGIRGAHFGAVRAAKQSVIRLGDRCRFRAGGWFGHIAAVPALER